MHRADTLADGHLAPTSLTTAHVHLYWCAQCRGRTAPHVETIPLMRIPMVTVVPPRRAESSDPGDWTLARIVC